MKIYVGYDSSQKESFDVCVKSIKYNSSIEIIPIIKSELEEKFLYVENKTGSTEFSFTRFLVPYLNDYKDFAIFCDSDFIWDCDPFELQNYIDLTKSVSVVKHDIKPEQVPKIKMDNQEQFWYPKKNWSSLMMFNCSHEDCADLKPSTISYCSGKYLHEFNWSKEENIGDLPKTYNYLVGYYTDEKKPKAIHFTSGGPWHNGYENVEFSEKWYFYKNV